MPAMVKLSNYGFFRRGLVSALDTRLLTAKNWGCPMDSPNSGSRAAEQIYSITPNHLSQLLKYEKQEILPNARKNITFFMKYCGLHPKAPGSIIMAQRDDKRKSPVVNWAAKAALVGINPPMK